VAGISLEAVKQIWVLNKRAELLYTFTTLMAHSTKSNRIEIIFTESDSTSNWSTVTSHIIKALLTWLLWLASGQHHQSSGIHTPVFSLSISLCLSPLLIHIERWTLRRWMLTDHVTSRSRNQRIVKAVLSGEWTTDSGDRAVRGRQGIRCFYLDVHASGHHVCRTTCCVVKHRSNSDSRE